MAELTSFSSQGEVHSNSKAAGASFGMTGWEKLASNKYSPLLHALYAKGPVAVALTANSLFNYASGIFDSCDDWVVNHAVTLVGFGKDKGVKYWMIQNSWGPAWGEKGRIRIARQEDEEKHCGMDDKPQDGVACKGETDPVKVCGTCGVLYDSVLPIFTSSKL
jgi:hypothetical protein